MRSHCRCGLGLWGSLKEWTTGTFGDISGEARVAETDIPQCDGDSLGDGIRYTPREVEKQRDIGT